MCNYIQRGRGEFMHYLLGMNWTKTSFQKSDRLVLPTVIKVYSLHNKTNPIFMSLNTGGWDGDSLGVSQKDQKPLHFDLFFFSQQPVIPLH